MAMKYAWSAANWSGTTWVTSPGGPTTSSAPTIGDTFDLGTRNTTYDQTAATFDCLIGTSGGQFVVSMASAARAISCDVRASGATLCIVALSASNRFTVNGSIYGGNAVSAFGMSCTGAGNGLMTVNGNITGGTASSAHGLADPGSSNNIIIVNGNVTGGSAAGARGINSLSNQWNVTLNGNATGGSASLAIAVTGSPVVVNNGIVTSGSGAVAISGGNISSAPNLSTITLNDCDVVQIIPGTFMPFVANTLTINRGGTSVGFQMGTGTTYLYTSSLLEAQQIRYRLALDGTTSAPNNTTGRMLLGASQSYDNTGQTSSLPAYTGSNTVTLASTQNFYNSGTSTSVLLGSTQNFYNAATSVGYFVSGTTAGTIVNTGGILLVKLTSDGLDSIPTTAPAGVATTFREMVVQTWRRWFKKTSLSQTELKTYADDGITAKTTQAISDDGATQVQEAA